MRNQLASIVLAAVIGGFISVGTYTLIQNKEKQNVESIGEKSIHLPVHRTNYKLANGTLDFRAASKKVMPTVVHVKSQVYGSKIRRQTQGMVDPFREFFGMPRQGRSNDSNKLFDKGSGSGVIINKDGYIVTNNHVIDGADAVEVSLSDSRVFTAEVVGVDPSTDLALLKIEESGLAYMDFSNSDKVEVGEWVLAVGNPFNLNSTVTSGIVSAKARNINILNDKSAIESFIQTDAAVNPGNSGGALVNAHGDLIGINTAIASTTGSFAGYSFAIPSNIVAKVVEDLLAYGMVQRAYLGIRIRELDAKFAKIQGLDIINGVYINDFTENSSAEKAGLEVGDVIVALEGVKVDKTPQLLELIAQRRPGDDVLVKIFRDGDYIEMKVQLKNRSGDTERLSKESQAISTLLGATFRQLSDEEKTSFRSKEGLVVESLGSGLLRKQTNMREGFIILRVGGKEVSSLKSIEDILKSKKGGVLIEGYYPNSPRKHYYAIGLEE